MENAPIVVVTSPRIYVGKGLGVKRGISFVSLKNMSRPKYYITFAAIMLVSIYCSYATNTKFVCGLILEEFYEETTSNNTEK